MAIFAPVLEGRGDDIVAGTMTLLATAPGIRLLGPLPGALQSHLAYVAVATGVHAGIALAAGQARQVLTDPRQERVVRRVLSVALAGVAVWLLWRT